MNSECSKQQETEDVKNVVRVEFASLQEKGLPVELKRSDQEDLCGTQA